jgi:hypothetical protein
MLLHGGGDGLVGQRTVAHVRREPADACGRELGADRRGGLLECGGVEVDQGDRRALPMPAAPPVISADLLASLDMTAP